MQILHRIIGTIADIFQNIFTVIIAGGKGRVHPCPAVPGKLNQIIDPADILNIYADPCVINLSRIADLQAGRNILGA